MSGLNWLTRYRRRWGIVPAAAFDYDRVDASDWVDAGTIPNVTLGTLTAFPMFETGHFELTFTESVANTVTAVTGEIRRSGSDRVRNLPTMYVSRPAAPSGSSGGGDPFAACIAPYLTEGEAYQVRFTITDGTNTATRVVSSTQRRLSARLPDWTATPTRYLSPSGSDAADGTTPQTAWRSWDKMILSAPDGAVVRALAGRYVGTTRARTTGLTVVAEYAATAEQTNTHLGTPSLEIVEGNAGLHTIVEPRADVDGGPSVLAPTGATDSDLQLGATTDSGTITVDRIGVWSQVSVTDESGVARQLWRALSVPVQSAVQLYWSDTREGATNYIANWRYEAPGDPALVINSKERFAERVYLNDTYQYGFWCDESASPVGTTKRDIYAKFPAGFDPNTKYITLHGSPTTIGQASMYINGPGVHLYGIEFRCGWAGVRIQHLASNVTIQRCLFREGYHPIHDFGQAGSNAAFSSDLVIYRNLLEHTGLYSDSPDATTIPWQFFKFSIRDATSTTTWSTNNVGSFSECTAIQSQGGAQRCLIQENTVRGYANGPASINGAYNGEASRDRVICRNLLLGMPDDPIEPEGNTKRWAIYQNKSNRSLTGISFAPVDYGPLAIYENAGYDLGWVVADLSGRKPGSLAFKFAASNQWASCQVLAVNNAYWANRESTGGGEGASGGGTYVTGRQWNRWLFYNNLVRTGHATTGGQVFEIGQFSDDALVWQSDGNCLVQERASRTIVVRKPGTNGTFGTPSTYRTVAELATFRTNYACGAVDNKLGGSDFAFDSTGCAVVDGKWTGPAATGDMRATHADFQGSGVKVRGFHFASARTPNRGFQP